MGQQKKAGPPFGRVFDGLLPRGWLRIELGGIADQVKLGTWSWQEAILLVVDLRRLVQ
jgi:hypothetical protein